MPLLFGVDLIDSISIHASKTPNADKTFHAKKKDPAQGPGLLANSENLAMVMAMMTTMMMGRGVGRNHRPSQNDERDGSKK
ncbi:MAG TPA: hypothetical protein VNY74_06875 [Edaphobacter sp.]|nr:hypothetical protein [Edaphobacter sp.]